MTFTVEALSEGKPGVYKFRADFTMAGGWALWHLRSEGNRMLGECARGRIRECRVIEILGSDSTSRNRDAVVGCAQRKSLD